MKPHSSRDTDYVLLAASCLNLSVPEVAIVPRLFSSSSFVIPTPLSEIVNVRDGLRLTLKENDEDCNYSDYLSEYKIRSLVKTNTALSPFHSPSNNSLRAVFPE